MSFSFAQRAYAAEGQWFNFEDRQAILKRLERLVDDVRMPFFPQEGTCVTFYDSLSPFLHHKSNPTTSPTVWFTPWTFQPTQSILSLRDLFLTSTG